MPPVPLAVRIVRIGCQRWRLVMAMNLKDASAAKKPKGTHGGNRGGDQKKKDEQPKKSSQAAGKDPHRGEAAK
jgi:hypothetical protein